MKQLTPLEHDRGNVRLYVKDDLNRRYVILDHGEHYAKYYPRFELYTHSKDGEPECPIKTEIKWVLTEGIPNTVFTEGLTND